MKIRILSDLHLEVAPYQYRDRGEDLVVLAGDVAEWIPIAMHNREALFQAIKKPTLYVVGNHEFHHRIESVDDVIASLRSGLPPHVRLMHREAVDIGGIRFLGCPLWTNFNLPGSQWHGHPLDRDRAMHAAALAIPDFVYLVDSQGKDIGTEGMAALHEADRCWLSQQIGIAENSQQSVVVITHWLPSPESIAPKHQGSILNPYFASDCRDLMRSPVRLWIHGHSHVPRRYIHNGSTTEIICNPRGTGALGQAMEFGFDPNLIVQITPAKPRRGAR